MRQQCYQCNNDVCYERFLTSNFSKKSSATTAQKLIANFTVFQGIRSYSTSSLAILCGVSRETVNWMFLCYFNIFPLFKQLYRYNLQQKNMCANEKKRTRLFIYKRLFFQAQHLQINSSRDTLRQHKPSQSQEMKIYQNLLLTNKSAYI